MFSQQYKLETCMICYGKFKADEYNNVNPAGIFTCDPCYAKFASKEVYGEWDIQKELQAPSAEVYTGYNQESSCSKIEYHTPQFVKSPEMQIKDEKWEVQIKETQTQTIKNLQCDEILDLDQLSQQTLQQQQEEPFNNDNNTKLEYISELDDDLNSLQQSNETDSQQERRRHFCGHCNGSKHLITKMQSKFILKHQTKYVGFEKEFDIFKKKPSIKQLNFREQLYQFHIHMRQGPPLKEESVLEIKDAIVSKMCRGCERLFYRDESNSFIKFLKNSGEKQFKKKAKMLKYFCCFYCYNKWSNQKKNQ